MADIRCSHCGNNNPDFFDNCQFCQSPLKSESMLHAGDEPKKLDTGDLEPILPDWLQDARQQNRDAVEDNSVSPETKPRIQNEPFDLLAGLASQAESDDDDVPDWLSSINPVAKQTPSMPSSKQDGEPSDFFSQFSQSESQSSTPSVSEPEQVHESTAKKKSQGQTDQLNDWLSPHSTESSEPVGFEPDASVADDSNSWMNNLDAFNTAEPEQPVEKDSEDLSWLHNLEATSKQTGDLPSSQQEQGFDFGSLQSDVSQDDLGWLSNLGGTPAPPADAPSPSQPVSSQDDLSWLDNLGGTPTSSFEEPYPSQPASSQEDLSWLNNLGGTFEPAEETPSDEPASSQEDLGWLKNLGDTPTSSEELSPSQPASSQEDLSWLNNLGDTYEPEKETPSDQPASSQEDLGWLKKLGSISEPVEEKSSDQSATSQEDLGWLNNLGDTPTSSEEPSPSQPVSSQEDLSWLSNLGDTTEPVEETPSGQPASSHDDLDWLNNLGSTEDTAVAEEPAVSAFAQQDDTDWMKNLGSQEDIPDAPQYTPRGTAPLSEGAGYDSTPDWLKSAMEEPSMPAPGELSLDWLASHEKIADADQDVTSLEEQLDEKSASSQGEPVSETTGFDLPFSDTSSESSQDVDSLFNVDMPDWMSQETVSAESSQQSYEQAAGDIDESLAPVELPSWVQAMRPVDSAISDISAGNVDQVTERNGPLAGFSGIIPFAHIGSSLRPKALSMKLQVTEEQQAGAVLMEQIINNETVALPSKSTTLVASQRTLRWVIAGLFLVVLSVMIGLGGRTIPIFASATMNELSNLISTLPENSPVLVVVDYEPSLSGELEVIAGPILDQLVLSRQSQLTFISMSPNGSGLADRLIKLNDGLSGVPYFNLGFLPGGSVGVLGFIENPHKAMPDVNVDGFSNFEVVIVLTDNVESGRVWVEQLEYVKSKDPIVASKPLLVVSSAQAGPMIRPYVSSGQVDIMLSGLSDAAQYEYVNNTRLATARSYWDAFGIGLALAVASIILGSLWSLFMGIRERRAESEQG